MRSDVTVASHVELSAAGRTLAALGDVDGDSVVDLCAGSEILLLHADGSIKQRFTLPVPPYPSPTRPVGFVRDTNSNGRPEIVIGSPGADVRAKDSGAISFCEIRADGSPDPALTNADASTLGVPIAPQLNDLYGIAGAPIGDLDHDGFSELAVGAP